MKRAKKAVISALAIGLSVGAVWAAVSSRPSPGVDPRAALGRWLTESGNLEIEIAPCGPSLCGTVVAVRSNRSMGAPDKEMKPVDTRSPMGMKILHGFVPTADGAWDGRIYNRENGRTYDCLITPMAPDRLSVRGYKFLPLLGKSQVWTRLAAVPPPAGAP